MGTTKRTVLATVVAFLIAGEVTAPPAEAQAPPRLDVYSDDFGGPNRPAPPGATRDTVFSMEVPQLRQVHRILLRVQGILSGHSHPPHSHPHAHGPCVPIRRATIDGDPITDVSTGPDGRVTVTTSRGYSFSADSGDLTALETVTDGRGNRYTIEVPIADPDDTSGSTGDSSDSSSGAGRSGATRSGDDGDGNRG